MTSTHSHPMQNTLDNPNFYLALEITSNLASYLVFEVCVYDDDDDDGVYD